VIPRALHQIWLGPRPEPTIFTDTWRRMCRAAGWEYRMWREAEIDAFGLENRRLYECQPNAAGMSDVARMEILKRRGGIYLDCDFSWSGTDWEKYLDLDHISFMAATEHLMPSRAQYEGLWQPLRAEDVQTAVFLSNGFLGAEPNHPIVARLVAGFEESSARNPGRNPPECTGCYLLSCCIDTPITLVPNKWIFPRGPEYFHLSLYNENYQPHAGLSRGRST
jgi:mannosyltransferase OCH1-like enzyme